jgi:hypothetical protein
MVASLELGDAVSVSQTAPVTQVALSDQKASADAPPTLTGLKRPPGLDIDLSSVLTMSGLLSPQAPPFQPRPKRAADLKWFGVYGSARSTHSSNNQTVEWGVRQVEIIHSLPSLQQRPVAASFPFHSDYVEKQPSAPTTSTSSAASVVSGAFGASVASQAPAVDCASIFDDLTEIAMWHRPYTYSIAYQVNERAHHLFHVRVSVNNRRFESHATTMHRACEKACEKAALFIANAGAVGHTGQASTTGAASHANTDGSIAQDLHSYHCPCSPHCHRQQEQHVHGWFEIFRLATMARLPLPTCVHGQPTRAHSTPPTSPSPYAPSAPSELVYRISIGAHIIEHFSIHKAMYDTIQYLLSRLTCDV